MPDYCNVCGDVPHTEPGRYGMIDGEVAGTYVSVDVFVCEDCINEGS